MNHFVLFPMTDTLRGFRCWRKAAKPIIPLAIFVLAALTTGGCALSPGPSLLERSLEVNRLFESPTVLSDHTYYYAGPQDKPDTIIAIRNDYEFQKTINWHKVDITEKQLQTWNMMIDNRHRIFSTYDGAYILTPDGKRAGVWYSKYGLTVIKYPEPNKIIIYRPDPTSDQRWREDTWSRNN